MIDQEKVLDKQQFCNTFADYFIDIFPDIYTKEEILTLLENNVSKISCVKEIYEDNKNVYGTYNSENKEILLKNDKFDNIAFHELLHALLAKALNYNFPNVADSDISTVHTGYTEAFTSYAESIFILRNRYPDYKSNYYKVAIENKNNYSSYNYGAIAAQQLNIIGEEFLGEQTLVNFLKGKDIKADIYNIMYGALKNNEEYSPKELRDTSLLYTYYYCRLFHNIIKNEKFPNFFLLQNINKSLYRSLKLNNLKDFNTSVYYDETPESKLLKSIFGYKDEDEKVDSIENYMSEYIIMQDNLEEEKSTSVR